MKYPYFQERYPLIMYMFLVSISLISAIVGLVFATHASVTIPYQRTIATAPNVFVTNVMACRVYRKAKFGLLSPASDTGREASELVFASMPARSQQSGTAAQTTSPV